MNAAMLILRVVIGCLFIGHGTQKLFGWFEGPGLDGTTGMLRGLGYHPARKQAYLAGLTETGAGALLVIGFLTPLAAAAIIGTMLNAYLSVHREHGPWNTNNGYEYPLVLGTAAFAIALTGAGTWSADRAAGWHIDGGWGLLALVFGLMIGLAVHATRREPASQAQAEAPEHEERRAA